MLEFFLGVHLTYPATTVGLRFTYASSDEPSTCSLSQYSSSLLRILNRTLTNNLFVGAVPQLL